MYRLYLTGGEPSCYPLRVACFRAPPPAPAFNNFHQLRRKLLSCKRPGRLNRIVPPITMNGIVMGSAILNVFPFRASLWRFMPHRQPLPLTFIIRTKRYHLNARADRFELFLLFR